jgi:hypothetical protein
MKAKTIHGNTPGQLGAALQESMGDGFHPTLAIIFVSIKQDREAVCEVFRKKGIEVIGATSSGEFIDGHQSLGGMVAMLLDLDASRFRILFREIGGNTLRDTAQNLLEEAHESFSDPAFILLSTFHSETGVTVDGESLIRYMEEVAGPDLKLFGGMAGDDITFTGTFVFAGSRVTDYGIAALVLDGDKIGFRGMALSGWKPIGISRTITKSEGNLIYTIDGQPALDTYLRFLGIDPSTIGDRLNFFNTEAVHYPIQLAREGRDPKMCNPIGYDEEKGALICESDIPQGATFRFSTPPDFDIVETVLEKAGDLREQTRDAAEALLIFSCAGRLSALGPLAQQENEGLKDLWEAPMAGFFTYGEFGRSLSGKHEFHSTTNSWVALKEKTAP